MYHSNINLEAMRKMIESQLCLLILTFLLFCGRISDAFSFCSPITQQQQQLQLQRHRTSDQGSKKDLFTAALPCKQIHLHYIGLTSTRTTATCLYNIYDDWRSDASVDTLPLDEETVQMCLDEFIYSDYGKTMFGVHDAPASVGITGEISLAEVSGPEVFLTLSGKFWHTRSHVLGRAAMYLNARIPEIMSVSVLDPDELNDFEEIVDECTGDVIETVDRRSVDFNGDRATMIYQGMDPDQRGPFVNYLGGDFKIIPS